MRKPIAILAALAIFLTYLTGCAPAQPFRSHLANAVDVFPCPQSKIKSDSRCLTVTPEVDPGAYELHFVEFDDQGWLYPAPKNAVGTQGGITWSQTDQVIARLRTLLDDKANDINLIVYVHGWKHNAEASDSDVEKFRQLLKATSVLERHRAAKAVQTELKPRKVVGVFIGWRGKSWNVWEPLLNLTFWTRKNTALHVSHGAVQELFSRLRNLQSYYDGPEVNPECRAPINANDHHRHCRVRSLMVGHSFGAWILYSAVEGALIESISASNDLPDNQSAQTNVRPIADLVLLLNPAFEASRYEPLHEVAKRYRAKHWNPPKLVVITSGADWATAKTFPIGRFFNTIAERPVTSEEQAIAIKQTPGNVDNYLTHRLFALDNTEQEPCEGWQPPGPLSEINDTMALHRTNAAEQENTKKFYESNLHNGLLTTPWARKFCGRVQLETIDYDVNLSKAPDAGSRKLFNYNSPVWNVRTDATLIGDHNDIMQPRFLEFVRQLYDDTTLPVQN